MGLVTGAEIGTYSTKVVTGVREDGVLRLSGVGKSKTRGVKNGRIVKPAEAGDSLKEATERAEEMASEDIRSISLGVGGDGLGFSQNEATVTISSEDRIVTERDVSRLKDLVSSVDVGINKKIVSTIPQSFELDGQKGVTNPVGLQGRRLDMVATLVTIEEQWIKNFEKTASRAGLRLTGLVPLPPCLGKFLLSDEERTRGKVLIDFGMDSTKLLVFQNGQVNDYKVFPLGGRNLTGDLAAKLNTTREEARRIKHELGLSDGQNDREPWNSVLGEKSNKTEREEVLTTLSARTEEIIESILSDVRKTDRERLLGYGVKITGGSARLVGLTEFLDERFEPRFEPGKPVGPVTGIRDVLEDPSYGPVLSLLNCVADGRLERDKKPEERSSEGLQLLSRVKEKIRFLFRKDPEK
jgi:cell division protein FtsA